MRLVVTGAAGFIGANIVRGLNERGYHDIIAVDDLTDGQKFVNLRDLQISDYIDHAEFYRAFADNAFGKVEAVFHEGACSDTMVEDGQFMMEMNYRCSRDLLAACQHHGTRLLYASSAATYGGSSVFREEPAFERPLNVYGYSKLLFDQVVRRRLASASSQIAGFRYFNVYGSRESHKGRMASVAFHHFNQLRQDGHVRLFGAYDDYAAGQHLRDFVFVDDVVSVKLWFFDHPDRRGIFNVGTGCAQPFNDVAVAAVNTWRLHQGLSAMTLDELVAANLIRYVPFPDALMGKYQSFTQADLETLRLTGYDAPFTPVEEGVRRYVERLLATEH